MKFLVTGGLGFIGSHIAEHLLEAGHSVRILDDYSTAQTKTVERLEAHTAIYRGDVRDPETCLRAVADCQGVFHLAALVSVPESIRRIADCHAINTTGTLNLLEAMRLCGVPRMVFASSAAVYDSDESLPKVEGMLPAPISPYGVSKLASEHYLQSYAKIHGITGVALRYFNVYGPGQDPGSVYSGVISKFIDQAMGREGVTLFGDGHQTRDFIFVGDVVRANLAAMQAEIPRNFAAINVGTGCETSLRDLINTLERLLQRDVSVEKEPPRSGDIKRSLADISLMRALLGIRPKTSLTEGLAALLACRARSVE